MAAGLAITSESGPYYNGNMTVFVVLSCIVAASGGLIFGYDIGISGGVTSMEPFLKKFFLEVYRKMKEDTKISNYCKFDSQLLAAFTSSLYIAGLIASLFASTVTRAFGRKASILVGGTTFLTSSAIGGAALDIYMLILGLNAPISLRNGTPKHIGGFNIGFQVCVATGILSANLLNYGTQKIKGGWGWRISLAMAVAPASILTIVYALVLFRTIKLSESTSLLMSALVTGGIGTVSTILPMILADKLGRKVLFLLGGIQILVSQVMIGSVMATQLGDHGGFSIGYA
ncbi:MFS domain-containing protein [Citrus sinensis]|nr:MFS domain-containing protein [Citrus sinensis]